MKPQAHSELRHTGIEFLDRVPWGTHICGFYETESDFLNMVTAFFSAGAAAGEYCLWITDYPQLAQAATAGLPVEIVPYTVWYHQDGCSPALLERRWREKVTSVVTQGYAGLRLVHHCSSQFPWDREQHLSQEAVLSRLLKDVPSIALCLYPLQACNLTDVIDLSNCHTFAFFRGASAHHEALSAANRHDLMRALSAEVVHEIRNPITAIRALMELLHTRPELNTYSDLIDKVICEVDRADALACQFLGLQRTLASLGTKGCNLNAVIESIRPLLEAAGAKRGQQVQIRLSPIPDIPCRPGEARQILLNLAQNAFEAMPADGILTITTEHCCPNAVLRVQDTGHGIPPEIIPKLGIPFFTTKRNGTGLGLPVCFRILEKYGAHATIESSKSGTTVTVVFPTNGLITNKGPH